MKNLRQYVFNKKTVKAKGKGEMDTYQVQIQREEVSSEMQDIRDKIWNIDEEKEEKRTQKSLIISKDECLSIKNQMRQEKKCFTFLDESKKIDGTFNQSGPMIISDQVIDRPLVLSSEDIDLKFVTLNTEKNNNDSDVFVKPAEQEEKKVIQQTIEDDIFEIPLD